MDFNLLVKLMKDKKFFHHNISKNTGNHLKSSFSQHVQNYIKKETPRINFIQSINNDIKFLVNIYAIVTTNPQASDLKNIFKT